MKCGKHPDYNPKDSIDGKKGLHKDCSICKGLYYDSAMVGEFSGEWGNIKRADIMIGPLNPSERGLIRYALGFDFEFDRGKIRCFNFKENNIYVETINSDKLIKYLKNRGLGGRIKEKRFVDV